MEIAEYKKAWEEFQQKMAALKKRQFEVLARIGETLDRQKMDKIREELK
ncbi:MAG: hypothetical protein UY41_C0055G0002 [Candidatus Moranbacteria bacterium GW2011_GWE1_49_15]|nr:MAG: hypothetical protein UX75_C0055G0002 [Candidatus Moranbacteria bacterium GW2011_GWE2_47_10]KKW05339.1 MAG: hypothetical protein UY41_C0055G0002 [Candidatus Moranbacteria bacterium GW2011_GWE1_49_15]